MGPYPNQTRIIRRLLLAGLAALPVAAQAQAPAPVSAPVPVEKPPLLFLQEIYEPYKKNDFKGQPYWEAKRFFAPDLAQAIERDFAEAKKRNEVPKLDGDPFVDAQDWTIGQIDYAIMTGKSTDHAIGTVGVENLGKPTLLALFLVKTPDGWRIEDIVTHGFSLRALYKLNK
jgi:hypothetical protein